MENALLIGLSRQMALSHQLDIVANNVANIDTTGFKADNAAFSAYLMPGASDAQFAGKDRRVSFVEDRASWIDFSPGAIQHTGNPLDVAIDGKGYFVVQTPRGERYTRNGSFADQCQRPARYQRRRSGARHRRPDHPSSHRSRRHHQPQAASSPRATAPAPPARNAVNCRSSASTSHRRCKRTAARRSWRRRAVTANPAPASTRVVQGAMEKSNVRAIAEMARMIEITRSYSDIAAILQQQGDLKRNSLQQLSQAPKLNELT